MSPQVQRRRLDVTGKVCPYPTVETQKALDAMGWGEVLEVVSDYMPARTTIPYLCWQQKFPWEIVEEGNGRFRVIIKKETGSPQPPPAF